jgi:hypothetical protein
MGLRAYGVAVLTATVALWLMSGTQRERSLLSDSAPQHLRALEAQAARRPADPAALATLAQAYLEAHQPGLAVALVEGAPSSARGDVRLEHVFSRALVDEGRNVEALAAEGDVVSACRPLAEAVATPPGCDSTLLAAAVRRACILGELVSLGVEDTQANPEEARIAYQNATREARVMVQ